MSRPRYLAPYIENDLTKKTILLSGPRQVGKTTLSMNLKEKTEYLNFDNSEDRLRILKAQWDRSKELLVLDELHKMYRWKQWLKGIYDKEKLKIPILVTGSARLETLKKAGDSLAGRHFSYRLHPFDLKELKGTESPEKIYQRLLSYSGFPEPYFENRSSFYNRWKRSHMDLILRQDLLTLELIKDISSFETMLLLLQERVGSPLSAKSISEDLRKDSKTIQNWLQIAENLYFVFSLRPYSKNIARSILKEPKIYFYDLGRIEGDEGVKLENLVALSLKKEIEYCQDAKGIDCDLRTLRLKGGKEVDFVVIQKGKPALLIEVKLSDENPSSNFHLFERYFPGCKKIQLVKNLSREFTTQTGIEVREVTRWLTHWRLD
jgi:predicted AAA+ superfamily ATPase